MMTTRHLVIACAVLLATCGGAWSQTVIFEDVRARFSKSATDRRLVDKNADLIFDDGAQKLVVKSQDHPLDVSYGDVRKVVFDVSTHRRGGGGGFLGSGGALGAVVGAAIESAVANKRVNDYWCHVEYRAADGSLRSYMLEIARDSSLKVIEKMQAAFGDNVTIAEFAEKAVDIEKNTLKDLQSKHDVKVDKENHPMPELKADKALVVVVSPPQKPEDAGSGEQVKLHANDRVVAVNKTGTYSFAYLDPGEHLLASQVGNVSGFRMTLEAGKEYYLLQNVFGGMLKARTELSRNTKELVMHELNGAYYSDWKSK